MIDFFDDFDWKDMAFWGGMADEFAEEERDRRRWERKAYRDPEDEFDFDNGFCRRPERPIYSRKRPRRKPFEQYSDDVCPGRKSHHDPLFGPAKCRYGGANRRPEEYTDTIFYGVQVKNAHLVSENFLKFVCTILYGHPDQEIERIVFDSNGNPVVNEHEVFSTFDRISRTITVNLRRHFANAVRVAEHGYTGFSMYALIWNSMVGTVLHELKHALDTFEVGYMDYTPREEQERIADQWSSEAKTYFARQGNSEMPALSAEPYFGPLVTQFLQQVSENDSQDWVQYQQEMITAGIFYRDKDSGIEICTMQEFYENSFRGLEGDEFGQRLNAGVKREQELEEKIWKHEETCEQALKEAIATNRKIRIDHVDRGETHFSQILLPRTIYSKNYYLWVDGIDAEKGDLTTIRVDRIGNVRFLS